MKWVYEPLFNPGSHSVVVITLDFDSKGSKSNDPGSTPGGSFIRP